MILTKRCIPFLLLFGMTFHATAQQSKIEAVLDDFHLAASEADYERYFGHLADSSIFFGTDMRERWTKSDFEVYAKPYFDDGRGWTYVTTERNIYVGVGVSWFDEVVVNEKYGELRGTGVLVLEVDTWKIMQYHLTLPVPNDLLLGLVDMIAEQSE